MENTRLKCFDVSGVFGGVILLCIISSTAKCNENNHVWDLFFFLSFSLSSFLSFLPSSFLLPSFLFPSLSSSRIGNTLIIFPIILIIVIIIILGQQSFHSLDLILKTLLLIRPRTHSNIALNSHHSSRM